MRVVDGSAILSFVVQSLSCVWLFATPRTVAHKASLFFTVSQSLLMSVEAVMPSNHLILCHPLLLPPSVFPSIRVFSNDSALRIKWPKYWEFELIIYILSSASLSYTLYQESTLDKAIWNSNNPWLGALTKLDSSRGDLLLTCWSVVIFGRTYALSPDLNTAAVDIGN